VWIYEVPAQRKGHVLPHGARQIQKMIQRQQLPARKTAQRTQLKLCPKHEELSSLTASSLPLIYHCACKENIYGEQPIYAQAVNADINKK
jgi:hypothetical protein